MSNFSQSAYNSNDPRKNPAIDEANKKALGIMGFTDIVLKCEDYGADYSAVAEDGTEVLIESQRLQFWKEGSFPYSRIGVFKRYTKHKHTQPSSLIDTPCYHLWLRDDLGMGYLASWTVILEHGVWTQINTFRGLETILETNLRFVEPIMLSDEDTLMEWF